MGNRSTDHWMKGMSTSITFFYVIFFWFSFPISFPSTRSEKKKKHQHRPDTHTHRDRDRERQRDRMAGDVMGLAGRYVPSASLEIHTLLKSIQTLASQLSSSGSHLPSELLSFTPTPGPSSSPSPTSQALIPTE